MDIRSSDVFLKADIAAMLRALTLTAHAVATAEPSDFERGYLTALAAVAVALIIVVGVGAWIVLWWRGRLYLAQVDQPRLPAQLAPPPEVVQIADARGGRPVLVGGVWHVERGGQLIARLRELPDRSRM